MVVVTSGGGIDGRVYMVDIAGRWWKRGAGRERRRGARAEPVGWVRGVCEGLGFLRTSGWLNGVRCRALQFRDTDGRGRRRVEELVGNVAERGVMGRAGMGAGRAEGEKWGRGVHWCKDRMHKGVLVVVEWSVLVVFLADFAVDAVDVGLADVVVDDVGRVFASGHGDEDGVTMRGNIRCGTIRSRDDGIIGY